LPQAFVVNSVALSPGCAQELGGLDGKVLIEFRADMSTLGWDGQDSFLRQVGGRTSATKPKRRAPTTTAVINGLSAAGKAADSHS
jgi:hypothetical protein